jgi:hypothetical protein
MIPALLLAAGIASGGALAPTAGVEPAGDPLPAEWVAGDFATPCAWNGTTIRLYADINDGDRRFARNAVAVDGQFMIQPLVSYEPDTFYWATDCTEQADGSLLVAALEVINRHDLPQDGWQFEVVDTDMFVVRQPDEHASWTMASKLNKIDDGWWGTDQVEFSDQWPGMAFGREPHGQANRLYAFDVDDVAAGEQASRLPSSDGPFAPVQTENGWFGYSWSWTENTATLWHTDLLGTEWTVEEVIPYVGQTHAHGLNVVGGELVHRWSVFTARPSFEAVDL